MVGHGLEEASGFEFAQLGDPEQEEADEWAIL